MDRKEPQLLPAEQVDVVPEQSLEQFISVFSAKQDAPTSEEARIDPLLAACRFVAKAAKIKLTPKTYQHEGDYFERINQLAHDSQFRVREVGLTGEWWKTDHGPLLVFFQQDDRPCALVPWRRGHYQLIDPVRGEVRKLITADLAAELHPYAYFFYRALPYDQLSWKDLLRFALQNLGGDLWRVVSLQIFMGLLGLLIPIVTGIVFDQVIPDANINLLLQFIIGLMVATSVMTLFQTSQLIGSMRIRYKLDGVLQPAIWDRLLRLPASFFRYFTAGNLSDRASGIDSIQQALTNTVVSAVLGGFFSVITLALMFYYSAMLTLFALALIFILACISLVATLIQIRYQRQIYQLQGIISGLLIQLFVSVSKLRIANREPVAFQLWAEHFANKTHWMRKSGYLGIGLQVFSTIASVTSTALLFLLVIKKAPTLSFGHFIAFNAAFGQFFSAIFAMISAVTASLEIVPLYERAKPILQALPETSQTGIVLKLQGHIRVEGVAFRYPLIKTLDYSNDMKTEPDAWGPWVFRDVHLEVKPGEFIALVGHSGAGKSSLFRLLLGFEKVHKGLITYDDYDLAALDHYYLRRQIGVVMQNSTLFPGTLIDNLRSTAPKLTLEEALMLLMQVQFERELADMPMGLFTLVSEGGTNLSVGQRQRILIAKALAHQPKILYLDEATSALDNQTQAGVYEFIRSLPITRLVAAHRLSTIQHADRIYVFHDGVIEQSGTFDELMCERNGLFYQLAERQRL